MVCDELKIEITKIDHAEISYLKNRKHTKKRKAPDERLPSY